MRIYPHLQDTGGFFVAVLQRKASPSVNHSLENAKAKTDRKRPALGVKGTDDPTSENGEHRTAKKVKLEQDGATGDSVDIGPVDEAALDVGGQEDIPETEQDDVKMVADASFKENPFTFLPKDDPNLVSCM